MIFCIGAGVFLYPAVSNFLLTQKSKKIIHQYDTKIDERSKNELRNAWQNAKIYNENLIGDPVHDPFVAESGYILPNDYDRVLNINNDGIMGYIKIPAIKVELPIYHGTSEDVLRHGVGHLQNTSLPSGGKNSYSVLCAHRGLPSGELFTRLDELNKGDIFYIKVLDELHTYQIYDIQIIKPEELTGLIPEKGLDKITLMTCTPYAVNTHRLLVSGKRIPTTETNSSSDVEKTDRKSLVQFIMISFIMLLMFFLYGCLLYKNVRKKGK